MQHLYSNNRYDMINTVVISNDCTTESSDSICTIHYVLSKAKLAAAKLQQHVNAPKFTHQELRYKCADWQQKINTLT